MFMSIVSHLCVHVLHYISLHFLVHYIALMRSEYINVGLIELNWKNVAKYKNRLLLLTLYFKVPRGFHLNSHHAA